MGIHTHTTMEEHMPATKTRPSKHAAVKVDDTPTNAHDCEMDEIEATRYEYGLDIPDSRYL